MRPEMWSIGHLLAARAGSTPDREAFTFLVDGEQAAVAIDYATLDRSARRIAAMLACHCRPGDRALLLCAPGLGFIEALFGCVYARVIAVPAYAPDRSGELDRLRAIAGDARPRVALITVELASRAGELAQRVPALADCTWLTIDGLGDVLGYGEPPAWRADARPEDIALLQYTSGSTGEPKGVVLPHAAVLDNLARITTAFGASAAARGLIWLPPYHDLGLVAGILEPVYAGFPTTLMSPQHFLASPLRWLRNISRTRATISGGPSFAYELCVRRVRPADLAGLDLSCWQVAFNGAEPVRAETLERFARTFAPAGLARSALHPCYGLAEVTLIATGGRGTAGPAIHAVSAAGLARGAVETPRDPADARSIVSVGAPVGGTELAIVDPETGLRCDDHRVGEIWIHGASLGTSYWDQPEATAAVFAAALPGDDRPWLRTGDLGFVVDGGLAVCGRHKDLIVIAGRHVHPADLERAVEAADARIRLGGVAAFAVDAGDREQAVVVCEVTVREPDVLGEIAGAIRRAVAESHGIELAAIGLAAPRALPRTSSGKLRRSECRRRWLAGALAIRHREDLAAPADPVDDLRMPAPASGSPVQRRLARIWEHVLGRGVASADADFFASGGHSAAVAQLVHRIEAELGARLALSEVYDHPTLRALAARIEVRAGTALAAPPRVADADRDPASLAQRRWWQLFCAPGSERSDAIVLGFEVAAPVPADRLAAALRELASRHEALRTVFVEQGGALWQQILPDSAPPVHRVELVPGDDDGFVRAAVARPFDLERGPLFDAAIGARPDGSARIVLRVHPLIGDGWSLGLLAHELTCALTGAPLPAPATVRYRDASAWQAARDRGAARTRWRAALAGHTRPELPADHPRPRLRDGRAGVVRHALPPALLKDAARLARSVDTGLLTMVWAAVLVVLARHTGGRELSVGTLASGRSHPAMADIIGRFATPVVLRTDLVDTEPVRAWLARLAADLSAARAHAEVAPDEIAEAIAAAREPGRNPLFDVLIDIAEPVELAVPGWTRLALDPSGAEVDLSISLARTTGWLELGYATDLYDAWRVERWAAEIAEAVAELTASPEQPVGALVAIHGAAADELQAFGRGAEIEAPPETLADVLRHAARKWPDAPAVVWPHGALTWRGLLIAAESRARRLGVPPGTAVGLWGEPSWQQLVSLWAIVLAGGAYVAADGPAERRRELWHAAGVDMALGPDDSALVVGSGRVPAAPAPGDPAYMLFTSEDAGPPRAVAVSHAAVVHRLRGEQQRHHLDARLRTVWLASLAFEVSVLEVVLPALVGGSVVIPDDREDLASVVELVDREAVTDLQATPSLAVGLAELWATRRPPHALTRLSLDGENLPAALLDRLRGGLPGVQIGNHEGASEAVVEALAASDLLQLDPHPIGPHGIGRPLPGTLVRIVDPAGQPVPVGADGEVCVGGAALATGYSGSSALDTASFGPDPWGEVNGLYHTRDAGRWRPDGTVELRGRLDRPQR